MQNPMQMIQMFNQFKNQINGNPKELVEQLLREGKMTQQQFDSLQKQATQFQQMMSSFKM